MKITNKEDIFQHSLQDIYSAEKQILEALPKMIDAATNVALRNIFTSHLAQTRDQVKRLKDSATLFKTTLEEKTCKGMEGILTEGMETVNGIPEGNIRDHAIIDSALKVEHYELASYQFLIAHVEMMEEEDIAHLLNETLIEEEEVAIKLVELHEQLAFT